LIVARKKTAVPTPDEQERARALVGEKWQRERELRVEKFLDGDGWPQIYLTWKRRMEEFAMPPDPLFMDVPIADKSGKYVGERQDWWYHAHVDQHRASIVDGLGRNYVRLWDLDPGARISKSIGQTVEHLWDHREEPEVVAAIMLAGSVFKRTRGRSSGRLADGWPSVDCIEAVERLANARWDGNEYCKGWSHMMSNPFPSSQRHHDHEYGIASLGGLINYFAMEHAATLLAHRLVNIRFIDAEKPKLLQLV
jgi:hypothetical protein